MFKTNSFIYASLLDDTAVLQSSLYHYTNIFLFSCLDPDQCQDDTKKKDIPLENMANQCIRYLDAKSKHMTMKCLEGEKQYSCSLKTNEE